MSSRRSSSPAIRRDIPTPSTPSAPGVFGAFCAAAGLAAYLYLLHWLMAHATDQPWAAAAVLGPIWCVYALWVWKKRHGPGEPRRHVMHGAVLAASAAAIAMLVARGGIGPVQRLYLLEYIAFHLGLGAMFAATLAGRSRGEASLIERIAETVHDGRLSAPMRRYARRLTGWWVAYFVAMALLSVAVYLLASWPAWTFFATVLTPLMVAVVFVAEHILRYWLHPEFERAGLMASIRAYRQGGSTRKAAP
jgi:uncharacterized membrane protein